MIRMTIHGVPETRQLFERLPLRLALAIFKGMQEGAIELWSKAKINAPVFRGLLRESILWHVEAREGRMTGRVGSALVYAPVVEFGRERGWFPNVAELRLWARRKLGAETAVVDGKRWNLAYVIGRAISIRGFQAQPYLTPAAEEVAPRVRQILERRLIEAIRAEGGK